MRANRFLIFFSGVINSILASSLRYCRREINWSLVSAVVNCPVETRSDWLSWPLLRVDDLVLDPPIFFVTQRSARRE